MQETVDLVEDIAVQFVTETVHAAMAAAAVRAVPGATGAAKQKSDVDVPDLLFAVRKDPQKVARIHLCCEVLISDCPVNGFRWLFGCVLLCGSWCRKAEE
jgi:hypothetical protein